MLEYLKYLNIPSIVIICIIALFVILLIIGEILEFKGKVVPEFLKIRKRIKRKKQEKQDVRESLKTLPLVKESLAEILKHYSQDNITRRNKWMDSINSSLEDTKKLIHDINFKLDNTNNLVLSLTIESKRTAILDFAQKVVDSSTLVSREHFNKIFKIYDEYEEILNLNNLENGEVGIAIKIIKEAYEDRIRNHSFTENIKGYQLPPN